MSSNKNYKRKLKLTKENNLKSGESYFNINLKFKKK